MQKNYHLEKKVIDLAKAVETVVKSDETVKEALEGLKNKHISDKIVYFYVVDNEYKLLGVVPTRKLLLSESNVKILDIMETSVIRLSSEQTLHDAMEIFARHSLLALPIVDNENKLLGCVDVEMYMEESVDIADARHRSDIFQIIGLSLEEEKTSSIFRDYRLRMPWIFCNLFGGIICAIISAFNENVLGKFLMLAMFIPLVLTLSESISMQSMTHSIHFMRRPKTSWRYSLLKALNEWKIVILMSLSCGIIVGIVSLFWGDGIMPSLSIGIGILISVTLSAAFGIMLPIILHKTKLDPKVASGPIVLMLADVLTTLLYLSIASWWLL
jgi:magnesium transporter